MATINARIWERHSHPWSGWLEVLIYPLVYVPMWNRSWRQGAAVAALFAIDTIRFPSPKHNTTWMTRGMLGEQRWMQQPPGDSLMAIVVLQTAAAITAFVMAYKRRLWPTIGFASSALLFKMWFLQCMVTAYDQRATTSSPSADPNT